MLAIVGTFSMKLREKIVQFWLKKDDGVPKSTNATVQTFQESDKERVARNWSLRLIYFQMFIYALSFSIVLTGAFPYVRQVGNYYYICLLSY